ncbi:PaaI family thioesterase [Brevundimonas sp. S30B]|uniref:PaaI family thioesterase n=1 Tax=unclassified Brevundimonas TaxID=2622653 RepID=UPI00107249A7|nr:MULTISPECIES: PaaI family thioesterase [unclassified Brevundimonas]QBX37600.1 PaaI family thioesterase [Brevundimonas sp. MF30-B]TFW03607.1 PaaI family thioesterase [Brevundimonas sp. S30B]
MTDSFLDEMLPQLASVAAHTHALGFRWIGREAERVRIGAPWREDLVGDADSGVLAGGLVTALLDHAGGLAIWARMGEFRPVATLDLRVDYMRAAAAGRELVAEARCYRLTSSIAFVRGWAFEDDPSDPVAAAQAAYMLTEPRGRSDAA